MDFTIKNQNDEYLQKKYPKLKDRMLDSIKACANLSEARIFKSVLAAEALCKKLNDIEEIYKVHVISRHNIYKRSDHIKS